MSDAPSDAYAAADEAQERYQRPDVLDSVTPEVRLGCLDERGHPRKLYPTISSDEGRVVEVIARLSREAGTCQGALIEAVCRLASGWLQSGGTAQEVGEAISGIRCPCPVFRQYLSCLDAIGKLLMEKK